MDYILNAYDMFSATTIMNRATTGICDMVVDGTTVKCTNITMTGIKNAIGASTNNLSDLCSHNNVNKYSNFSPRTLTRGGDGYVVSTVKTPYKMSSFAGYNHNAYPSTYFINKLLAVNGTKNSSYVYTFSFSLDKGEIVPVGTDVSWSYVRVKIVITDNTYNRTLTFYSATHAVGTAYTVTFQDDESHNLPIVGTAYARVEYMDSTGSVVKGYGEDEFNGMTVNIDGYYITYTSSNFADDFGITFRWYYVKANVSPYNELVYSSPTPMKKCNSSTWNNYDTDADLLAALGSSGAMLDNYPNLGSTSPSNQWSCVGAVLYNSATGKYRYYQETQLENGDVFDNIYKVGSGLGYIYKLDFVKQLSGYPLTTTDLA